MKKESRAKLVTSSVNTRYFNNEMQPRGAQNWDHLCKNKEEGSRTYNLREASSSRPPIRLIHDTVRYFVRHYNRYQRWLSKCPQRYLTQTMQLALTLPLLPFRVAQKAGADEESLRGHDGKSRVHPRCTKIAKREFYMRGFQRPRVRTGSRGGDRWLGSRERSFWKFSQFYI